MIRKVITSGNSGNSCNVDYKTDKKAMVKPTILDTFMDDNGEDVYILSNERTQLARLYNAFWNPPKSTINWKTKGENPDKTRV